MRTISLYLLTVILLAGCNPGKDISSESDNDGLRSKKQRELYQLFIEGNSQEFIGNYAKAKELYLLCIQKDKKNPAPYYAMSQVGLKTGDYLLSLENAQKAFDLEEENSSYRENLANVLYQGGEFMAASQHYVELSYTFPKEVRYYLAAADCFEKADKPEEAIRVYERAEETMGPTPDFFTEKYRLYLESGKEKDAIGELVRMVETDPTNIMLRIHLAQGYESLARSDGRLNMEYIESAYEEYKRVIELDPESGYGHLGIARYKDIKGDDDVTEHMIKAFRSPDLNIDDKVRMLLDYYEQTHADAALLEEAYQLLEAMLLAHPEDPKTYAIYGDFLSRDDQLAKARDMFVKSVGLAPDNYVIWNEIMVLDARLSDYDSLYLHSGAAMELFPNQADLYYFRGLGAYQTGQYDEAIESLENGKLLLLNPSNSLLNEYNQTLADAHYRKGELNEAFALYDEIVEKDPSNTYVLNNYAYYLSLEGRDLEKAATMAKRANELVPGRSSYQDTYGWVLFLQGKFDSAEEWIGKAVENGGSAVVIEHYGDVQFKLGNPEEAIKHWKEAKEKGSETETLDEKIRTGKYIE